MWQILETILGNVVSAIILAILGIGATTIVVKVGSSGNPRKKWRVLMVIAFFGWAICGSRAEVSEVWRAFEWIFGFLFVLGFFGNWVNK